MKYFILTASVLSVISFPVMAQQTIEPAPQYQPYNMNQNNVPTVIPSGNAIGQQMVIPRNGQRQLGNNIQSPYQRSGVEIQNLRKNKKNNQAFIDESLERNRANKNTIQKNQFQSR